MDYILSNWISEHNDTKGSPENKVKRLLDRCGTLLLRDIPADEKDTLTDYREKMNGSRELNVSDCPLGVANMVESGAVDLQNLHPNEKAAFLLLLDRVDAPVKAYANKKREDEKTRKRLQQTTKFSRLQQMEREHPGCETEGCRVDTDGVFEAHGIRYRISPECKQYAPHHTRYGDQYDMDRVLVFTCPDGQIVFADQEARLMDQYMITKIDD